MAVKKSKTIILGVTASIAIYKACEIVRRLSVGNFKISVVMTKNATRLISPQVFSSLIKGFVYPAPFPAAQSCNSVNQSGVYWNSFADDSGWDASPGIEHISLAKKADLVLIAPATANVIGKIAGGIADDLLTTTVMATNATVLIAPAMNKEMYANKIVQTNIQKLKALRYKFVEPKKGRLACGDVGKGHLADIDTIIKETKKQLA